MVRDTDGASVRLAELVAALSLGVDLGFGQPMEHVLRQCLIALRLADRIGLGDEARADVYYTALLVNVGCHADAHEQAKWFGDDIELKSGKYDHELGSLRGAAAAFRLVGSGNPPLHRFRVALEFMLEGRRDLDGMVSEHARIARLLGEELNLSADVLAALGSAYEQWNGRGWPGELKGAEVPLAARLAQLAEFTEVAHRVGGVEAAKALARGRAGKQFDPALAELVCSDAELIFAGLDGVGTWDTVIDAEPGLALVLSGEQVDDALLAIANFVDLKSPYTLGHAAAVARARSRRPERAFTCRSLTCGRCGARGCPRPRPARRLQRDLGQARPARRRRVGARAHPPVPDRRMLHQSDALAPLASIAVAHRERLDGSGYPRGLSGSAISRPARILAAADAYQAMREPRPYRPPRTPEEAATELRADVKAAGSTRMRSRRCSAPPAIVSPAASAAPPD